MTAAPVTEKGLVVVNPNAWWPDDTEETPELRWPECISVYDRMRRQDSQVRSSLAAVKLPIRRTTWRVAPNGARPRVVQAVADELGLPIVGQPPRPVLRTRDRFSWAEHLRLALLMLDFGHSFFEQAYRIEKVGSLLYPKGFAHIRKLGWRPPRTISRVQVARDGGLEELWQYGVADPIPVTQLVGYVNEREGGNWLGQALDPETPIPTPDGWKTMGELEVGDRVFDETGAIRHVVARKAWTNRPCFKVTFGDGEEIIADENHQWLTHDFRYRCQGRGLPTVRTTSEIADTVTADKSGTSNHAIPLASPVQHVERYLPVDPYVLGYWLGDGCRGGGRIVTADAEVIAEIRRRGYECREANGTHLAWQVIGLARQLRALGVIDNKRVPWQYLVGNVQQRLDLLRGLMDSDGTATKEGQCVFANTDQGLIDAVTDLVRSLGIRATVTLKRQAGRTSQGPTGPITSRKDVWHVQFATHLPVFALPRKLDRLKVDNNRRRYHIIKSVEPVAPRTTICIEVDSPSHLFLAGNGYVPTHNSLLRPAYKPWMLKDRALRVQAQSLERNGLGIPVYIAGEDPVMDAPEDVKAAVDQELAAGVKIAQGYRAGENAGAAIRHGAQLQLTAVQGALPNSDKPIRYYDEQISAAVLANFLSLGGDNATGSYALGQTFADFFVQSLQTVALDVADVATMHIVEDFVDLNFGLDEPAPRIVFDEIGANQPATAQAIKMLTDAGALTPDGPLETFLRERYGLPALDLSTARKAPTPAAPNPGGTA